MQLNNIKNKKLTQIIKFLFYSHLKYIGFIIYFGLAKFIYYKLYIYI
jgi:hypothetical protein